MRSASPATRKIWRVIDLIHWAEKYFSSRGFEKPRNEIEWLLRELLKCRRIDLYMRFEEPIEKQKLIILRGWVQRRVKREPLQYITGTAEFYGLPLMVNSSVLIPRPETERLVDVALDVLTSTEDPEILDIGTGSGCVALAIAKEKPTSTVTGIDISKDVVCLAKKNANKLEIANVQFIQMDILKDVRMEKVDLIVSNPPYIPADEIKNVMENVRNFEPEIALTDDADGLTFYHRLAKIGSRLCKSGGWILMEVGLGDHPKSVMKIFKKKDYTDTTLIKDYNGDPRVIKVRVP